VQGAADEPLVAPGAVDVTGEERDAGVNRAPDGGEALVAVADYLPDMPMHPRPTADTDGPAAPSRRWAIDVVATGAPR
jgi:hypothetical protein